jgi:hypothetical protein
LSARLLPNFGGEEGRPLVLPLNERARALCRCWARLFETGVEGEGGLDEPALAWSRDEGPAFPFLAGVCGLVPWLVTDDVEALAHKRGLPLFGPSAAAARLVGDKAWAHQSARALGLLPPLLEELVVVLEPAELIGPEGRALVDEALARWPLWAQASWILKPRAGSSARGRVSGRGPRLDDAGAGALGRLAARGGALLEPWLARAHDLSAQLHIDEGGGVELLATTRQLLSPAGIWRGNTGVIDDSGRATSGSPFEAALASTARAVGARAAAAGFRGPCGLDAFVFAHEGEAQLRALVEVNARFTMGQISAGLLRRALAAGLAAPGSAWTFRMAPGEHLAGARLLPVDEGGAALALH